MNSNTVLRLVVVSSANRCRSALAECVIRRDWSGRAVQVSSAGLDAGNGLPADKIARAAALDAGLVTIEAHRSQQVSDTILGYADLILVMDESERREVLLRMPNFTGRVYRLGEWRDANIPSPRNDPDFTGAACLKLIRACIRDWGRRLEASGLLLLRDSNPRRKGSAR